MFDEPILMLSAKLRTGPGQWAGEMVATFGLVGTILACLRFRKDAIPYRGRPLHHGGLLVHQLDLVRQPGGDHRALAADTFAGILPGHAPAFIAAQLVGAVLATWLFGWLLRPAGAPVPAKELRTAAARDLG